MENYDYMMIDNHDKNVLKHLSDMGEKLKKLKAKQLELEEAAATVKKEYEHYANVLIPNEMHACGIDSIHLASGGSLSIKRNFYCQPNKNAEDRKIIVDWLRANGGGHLVEHNATVDAADFEELEISGIPFIENTTVNTMRLKSFLKDGIGATSGVQQFTMEDIPACIHFSEVTVAEINLK